MIPKNTTNQNAYKWTGARARAFKARILALIAPTSQNEDTRRQELILNIILLFSTVFMALLDATIILNSIRSYPHYRGIPWTIFTTLAGGCIAMFIASKRGYARAVSYIFICFFAAGALYGGWRWGISVPAILLTFALISITSSILIGSSFGFLVSGLLIISMSVLAVHEIYSLGVLPWKYEIIRSTDVITYSAILIFIAALSWLSNREIQKSLNRARASEFALAEERDLLEVKVIERTDELHQAQAERMAEISRIAEFGRLSQGLFHDLMTPLSSVTLHMEKLRNLDAPEAHEARAYLAKAVTASYKMGNFMNLIRSHIRQNSEENHQDVSARKLLSIADELHETLELLEFKARHAKVAIEVNVEPDIFYPGNAIYFQRIFLNLVSNAIEAHEETPDRTDSNEKRIDIAIYKKNDAVEINISDNGPGISAENTKLIFEPFFSTKSPEKGIGVGLSTVKNIVEKEFKGTITVKSTPGDKTSFIISLPCN
jgi:signal transduction histidine kinase